MTISENTEGLVLQMLLSSDLFRETHGTSFFRVLSGKNAPFYVDVLDELERVSSDRADGLLREEVVQIICDILERHPEFEFDEDEEAIPTSQRERSLQLLAYLIRSNWLEEPPRRDWKRKLLFDAHGAVLMAALRKIARPEAAVFTDKLVAVCSMLADEAELSNQPWQVVETCISNVSEGLNDDAPDWFAGIGFARRWR